MKMIAELFHSDVILQRFSEMTSISIDIVSFLQNISNSLVSTIIIYILQIKYWVENSFLDENNMTRKKSLIKHISE